MAKKKTIKKNKKTLQESILEKQLFWIIGFVVLLVILFFVAGIIFRSFNKIEYEGLTFTKERFGEIPVFHYYYFIDTADRGVIQYNLYLRNDPRTNDVPVEGGEEILFSSRNVYITVDPPNLAQCSLSQLGVGDLTSFFVDNQFNVRSGVLDFVRAPVYNQTYVTCDTVDDEVIELKRGNETKIVSDGQCHQIIIGPQCNIVEAVEKFKVESVLRARERAGIGN